VVHLRQATFTLRENFMKIPRSSIAGLMVLVVFAAANSAAVKWLFQRPSVWKEMCLFGVLPMANLLAIGLLPWLRRRPHRAGFSGFRIGFEVCGVLAIVAFLVLSLRFTDYLFQLPQSFFASYVVLTPGLGLVSSALIIFFGPQLAFAVLGGCLVRLITKHAYKHTLNTTDRIADATR
jgi:hypothetical protein